MPLYEYTCSTCGDFEVWRSISERSNPVHCQLCQSLGKRIFSAPNVNLSSGRLASMGRKVSDEPRLVKREAEAPKPRQQAAPGRPWMIGHPPERL